MFRSLTVRENIDLVWEEMGRPFEDVTDRLLEQFGMVHFALENDGWNCTFECEVHVSAPGGARHGPRRERLTDFRRFSCP